MTSRRNGSLNINATSQCPNRISRNGNENGSWYASVVKEPQQQMYGARISFAAYHPKPRYKSHNFASHLKNRKYRIKYGISHCKHGNLTKSLGELFDWPYHANVRLLTDTFLLFYQYYDDRFRDLVSIAISKEQNKNKSIK